MSQYNIVAIGASAGGLKALTEILSNLSADLPTPVLIVQHLDPRHKISWQTYCSGIAK